MTYKSRQDLLFASSFSGPVPRGRAGKEYHSTLCRRSRAQPSYLGANKCCATHPAPACTTQSGQITPAFFCHRNLVKFRDIEYILNFQLGRGPNPKMVHRTSIKRRMSATPLIFKLFRSFTAFVVSLLCRNWLSNSRSVPAIILRKLSNHVSPRSCHFLLSTCLLSFSFLCLRSVGITKRLRKMPVSKHSRPDPGEIWRRHASEIRKLYRDDTVENVKHFMEKTRGFPEMA